MRNGCVVGESQLFSDNKQGTKITEGQGVTPWDDKKTGYQSTL